MAGWGVPRFPPLPRCVMWRETREDAQGYLQPYFRGQLSLTTPEYVVREIMGNESLVGLAQQL